MLEDSLRALIRTTQRAKKTRDEHVYISFPCWKASLTALFRTAQRADLNAT